MTLEQEARLYQSRRRKDIGGTERTHEVQDPQLDRAVDALTGVLLYTERATPPSRG
jgi:hypothetical protein